MNEENVLREKEMSILKLLDEIKNSSLRHEFIQTVLRVKIATEDSCPEVKHEGMRLTLNDFEFRIHYHKRAKWSEDFLRQREALRKEKAKQIEEEKRSAFAERLKLITQRCRKRLANIAANQTSTLAAKKAKPEIDNATLLAQTNKYFIYAKISWKIKLIKILQSTLLSDEFSFWNFQNLDGQNFPTATFSKSKDIPENPYYMSKLLIKWLKSGRYESPKDFNVDFCSFLTQYDPFVKASMAETYNKCKEKYDAAYFKLVDDLLKEMLTKCKC